MRGAVEQSLEIGPRKATQHHIRGGCNIKINRNPFWPADEIGGEEQTHRLYAPILQGFRQGNHPCDHRGDKFQGRAPLHDLRAGGKTAVGFNRSELIELRRITPRTDRAVPNGACGAVNRAEVRHAGHLL